MERMRDQLTERLQQLQQEYDAGQKMLADLASRQLDVQQTLLRIGGAIQVLEELLAADEPARQPGPNDDGAAQRGTPVQREEPAGRST